MLTRSLVFKICMALACAAPVAAAPLVAEKALFERAMCDNTGSNLSRTFKNHADEANDFCAAYIGNSGVESVVLATMTPTVTSTSTVYKTTKTVTATSFTTTTLTDSFVATSIIYSTSDSTIVGLTTQTNEVTAQVTATSVSNVEQDEVLTVFTTTTVVVNPQKKRAADTDVPYPTWLPTTYAASSISSACTCQLSIAGSVVPITATADPKIVTTKTTITVTPTFYITTSVIVTEVSETSTITTTSVSELDISITETVTTSETTATDFETITITSTNIVDTATETGTVTATSVRTAPTAGYLQVVGGTYNGQYISQQSTSTGYEVYAASSANFNYPNVVFWITSNTLAFYPVPITLNIITDTTGRATIAQVYFNALGSYQPGTRTVLPASVALDGTVTIPSGWEGYNIATIFMLCASGGSSPYLYLARANTPQTGCEQVNIKMIPQSQAVF